MTFPANGSMGAKTHSFIKSFLDLLHLPRAFWLINGLFLLDNLAYFGCLLLMTTYLSTDLAWGDGPAGVMVAMFTGMVTLFMLGVGSFAERFGLRRAILFALLIATIGRSVYSYAYFIPGAPPTILALFGSLMLVALAAGITQPVCYSGIKQYTDEKTNSMGYGLLYGFLNLGMVIAGAISAWVRPAVERLQYGSSEPQSVFDKALMPLARRTESGIQAVNWVMTGVTALTFVLFALIFTRKAEAAKIRPDIAERSTQARDKGRGVRGEGKERLRLRTRFYKYFAEGPFTNTRFVFFIFMLLPVRTLFAHQWLTFPQYILRAYPKSVSDYMEWIVQWINPLVIFIGVPIATALTKHVPVYRMMMIGTLVSAVPTFLLAGGPHLSLLIAYFVIFSIGECLWSARFYEYASEIAPPGRVAQYMGLANVPWLLAKTTTGSYSGYMLAHFCPENVPREAMRSGTLWLIYGGIALTTPIGLWLARKWAQQGMRG